MISACNTAWVLHIFAHNAIPLLGSTPVMQWHALWQQFLMAVMFLTRLPVYRWVRFDAALHTGISRWFALVGALVALIHIALLWSFMQVLPWWPAIILSTGLTILLTGAFHEDGFADMCDAFGGGWEKEHVLLIMKDSRLGTYGTLGLTLMLGAKISLLGNMDFSTAARALFVGHVLSRALSTSLLLSLDYVKDSPDPSKIKTPDFPFTRNDALFLLATCLPAILSMPLAQALIAVSLMWALRSAMAWYLKQRLGGYTGDCLGGTQQLAELAILIILCSN